MQMVMTKTAFAVFSVTIVYKNSNIYIQILLTFSQQALSNCKELAHNITNYKHLNNKFRSV